MIDLPWVTVALVRDPLVRANYYLQGMVAQYRQLTALVVEYNGLVPIDCDGIIQQVTWQLSLGGFTTTASANNEHNIYVPPFPERRRAEYLTTYMRNVDDRPDMGRVADGGG